MHLEDFFIKEYERLKDEVESLKKELSRYKPHEFGIQDLGHTQDMIRIDVASHYYLDNFDSDYIEKLLDKSDEELFKWGVSTERRSYYGRVIVSKTETFPFTVRVKNLTSTEVYATDGCSEYHSLELPEGDEFDYLGVWADPAYKDYLTEIAVKYLREELNKAYKVVKKREEEKKEES